MQQWRAAARITGQAQRRHRFLRTVLVGGGDIAGVAPGVGQLGSSRSDGIEAADSAGGMVSGLIVF